MKRLVTIVWSIFATVMFMVGTAGAGTIDFESPTYTNGPLIGQNGWYATYGGDPNYVSVVSGSGEYVGGQAITGSLLDPQLSLASFQLFEDPDNNVAYADMRSKGVGTYALVVGAEEFGKLRFGIQNSKFYVRVLLTGGTANNQTTGASTIGGHWYHITASINYASNTISLTARDLTAQVDVSTGITDLDLGIPGADAAARQAHIAGLNGLYLRGPAGGSETWGAIDNINNNIERITEINFEEPTYTNGILPGQDTWHTVNTSVYTNKVVTVPRDGEYPGGQAITSDSSDPQVGLVYFQFFKGPDNDVAHVDLRSSGAGAYNQMVGPGETGKLRFGIKNAKFDLRILLDGGSANGETNGTTTVAGHWYRTYATINYTNNTISLTARDLSAGADVSTGITDIDLGAPGVDAAARQAYIAGIDGLYIRGPIAAGIQGAETWGAVDNFNYIPPLIGTVIVIQ